MITVGSRTIDGYQVVTASSVPELRCWLAEANRKNWIADASPIRVTRQNYAYVIAQLMPTLEPTSDAQPLPAVKRGPGWWSWLARYFGWGRRQ